MNDKSLLNDRVARGMYLSALVPTQYSRAMYRSASVPTNEINNLALLHENDICDNAEYKASFFRK